MAIRFELVNVTPEMAAQWLGNNHGNRRLREKHAASLARAMDEGRYKLTHQAIALTRHGRIIDGQHRCRAVCLHGKAVKMYVAHDVPEDVFAVLDSGMPRKMHERLRSDPTYTTIMTQMFVLLVRLGRTQEYEISTMLDVFQPALEKFGAVAKKTVIKGFRSSHQAAIVLRIAMAIREKNHDEVARIQWLLEKIHRQDLTGAPPIIASFFKQVKDGVTTPEIGVSPVTDLFCRAWRAFDALNEGTTLLKVVDHESEVRDAKLIFKFVSEGVFD